MTSYPHDTPTYSGVTPTTKAPEVATTYQYVSPTGSPITGTLERLTGRADVTDWNEDGTPNYDGNTEVFWEGQMTERSPDGKGGPVVLDENGDEWALADCTRVPAT